MPTRPVHFPIYVALIAFLAGAAFAVGTQFVPSSIGPSGDDHQVTLASATEGGGPLLQFVQRRRNLGPSSEFVSAVTCPVGYRAVAGGGRTSLTDTYMTDSARGAELDRQWYVRWETAGNAVLDPLEVDVYALCKRT